MTRDLTDEETAALVRLLRETIDNDHYPLSPRVRTLRVAKIRPEPPREPLPPRHCAQPMGHGSVAARGDGQARRRFANSRKSPLFSVDGVTPVCQSKLLI